MRSRPSSWNCSLFSPRSPPLFERLQFLHSLRAQNFGFDERMHEGKKAASCLDLDLRTLSSCGFDL